jgi:hypothetical protein
MKRYSIHICKSEEGDMLILVCSGGIDPIYASLEYGSEGILCQTKNRYCKLRNYQWCSPTDHACGLTIEENSSG